VANLIQKKFVSGHPAAILPPFPMSNTAASKPLVGIIMGSSSDWPTLQNAAQVLTDFGIPFEKKVVSAHRTPQLLYDYATTASERGLKCIIAGAGGAAHLPGMTASMTTIPVLGVPVQSRALSGVDSLYSIVQMPGGIPVATFAIGNAGALNAGLFAVSMLANDNPELVEKLKTFRERQTQKVLESQKELEVEPKA
jgi:5-(carboxyamino)imidazole ribonucleotide mutase